MNIYIFFYLLVCTNSHLFLFRNKCFKNTRSSHNIYRLNHKLKNKILHAVNYFYLEQNALKTPETPIILKYFPCRNVI